MESREPKSKNSKKSYDSKVSEQAEAKTGTALASTSSTFNINQFDNDEHSLPKATLTQIIKEFLPESMRMSQQSSDLMIQLSMHFLNYLSDTSNNVCNEEGKKTITPSHVIKALKQLKMHGYLAKILEIDFESGQGNGSSNDEDVGNGNLNYSAMSGKGVGRGRGRGAKLGDVMIGGLTDKQAKKIIEQKLALTGKKRRGLNSNNRLPEGKTEEEMIEEQRRLFEEAINYKPADEEEPMEYGDEQQQQMDQQHYQHSSYPGYHQGYMTEQQYQHYYYMQHQAHYGMPYMGHQPSVEGGEGEQVQAQYPHSPFPGGNLQFSYSGPPPYGVGDNMVSPFGLQANASAILQKARSCKEVEEMNFDDEEDQQKQEEEQQVDSKIESKKEEELQ